MRPIGGHTPPATSARMRAVRRSGTEPERRVRRWAREVRLHVRPSVRALPGSPDLVNHRLRIAIFVHGCFWHRHGCAKSTVPRTNVEFWRSKFSANVLRDRRKSKELRALGYTTAVVWECQARGEVQRRLANLLSPRSPRIETGSVRHKILSRRRLGDGQAR